METRPRAQDFRQSRKTSSDLCNNAAQPAPPNHSPNVRRPLPALGTEAQLKSPACRMCIRAESSNAYAHHAGPYQHYCRTPSPRVSCRDQKLGRRAKSKKGKTGRSSPQLNEKSFACTIGGVRIRASGCFTNSPGGFVDEPVSRQRNADSQEQIDPQQESGRR